jgi:hypothetical protein
MFTESDNYVYRRASNPFNRTLTCRGSRGGEGANVATFGSIIRVSTDLGSSVPILDGITRKSVFGVTRWDEYVMLWPLVRRAVEIAVSALTKAGYEGTILPSPP